MIERQIAPKIAAHQLLTVNPGKMAAQILIIAPLITKVKNPSVKIFIGKVRTKKIGQRIAFANPISNAARHADINPLT